jgi:hypothetical protein
LIVQLIRSFLEGLTACSPLLDFSLAAGRAGGESKRRGWAHRRTRPGWISRRNRVGSGGELGLDDDPAVGVEN